MALLLWPAANVGAQAAGQGKIEGMVVDGTKDAKLAAGDGITITLYSAPMGATSAMSTTAQADATGKFSFGNLDTITTTRYLVQATYQNIDYYTDILSFGANQTTMPISVTVFETTTDPTAISVPQAHFVFDTSTGDFNILQIIAIQNTGDRTYIGAPGVGPHRATLTLPVLPGADTKQIQFDNPQSENTTLRGDGVMTYTIPFPPGQDQIVYNYTLPYTPTTYQFSVKMPFNADRVRILVPEGITVQGPLFSAQTPFPTQSGQNFSLSTAETVTVGTVLNATFGNLPKPDAAASPLPAATAVPSLIPGLPKITDNNQLVGLVVLALAAIGAVGLIVYPIMRRRNAAAEEEALAENEDEETEGAAPVEAPKNERMELLQQIADLDDEYEAGKITEAEYKEQRAAIKAKLLELGK